MIAGKRKISLGQTTKTIRRIKNLVKMKKKKVRVNKVVIVEVKVAIELVKLEIIDLVDL